MADTTPSPGQKSPTPQAISTLLKRAGFKRSVPDSWHADSGYRVTKSSSSEGSVRVRHIFLTMGASNEQHRLKLDAYAKAIEAAGWTVEPHAYELIVTAGKAG